MNNTIILPILVMFAMAGIALARYLNYKNKEEKVYKFYSPLFLMIAFVAAFAATFMLLSSLGLVK